METLFVLFGTFVVIASLMIIGFENYGVYAEETNGFAMAEDISAHLTFHFRDGVEKQEFAVFKTTDFVNGKWVTDSANFMDAGESTAFQSLDGNYLESNLGTSFQVQGVVSDLPHLHKALDEAYNFRTTDSINYNYKFFDINVEFTHASGRYDVNNLAYQDTGGNDNLLPENVKPRKTLHYEDCQVTDYLVGTQRNAYRSYNIQAETGFAIVETIEFQCGGIHSEVSSKDVLSYKTPPNKINDFGKLDYKYADDIRTFITFEFDNGTEKIEFPFFKLISGFAEDDDPSFHVEGVVNRYPLLSSAIDNARDNRGIQGGSNTDFNAKVEFVQETKWGGEKILRGINYEDCNIKGSAITTYYENEEIYLSTGGSGIMQTIDFDCAGMDPQNPRYDESITTNEIYRNYNMASGPKAIAEFRFEDNTIATIDFPIFRFQNILTKSYPTFQLEGMVGEYPLLYKQVDEDAKINQISGVTQTHKLFDVDVNLKYGEQTVIVFSYSDCRIIDYKIRTEHQNEEGFWRGLASENTFEFECQGFKPKAIDDGMILDAGIEDKTTTWSGITFDGYLQAENVTSDLTFTFREGEETHEFPVFKTTDDFAENKGTSFQVQGLVADTPHLHKALEEAFKHRLTNRVGGFEYNYRYFDVDAVLTSNDESRKTFHYIDCQIEDYQVDTLSHTHRGYLPLGTGFAIVETIDFDCNGVHSKVTSQDVLEHRTEPGAIRELPKLGYDFADNVHTYVTFEFDNGIEKMEFPIFKINSGFAEDDDPSFHVEGIVNQYPLLSSAVDHARDVRDLALGANTDFNAKVEFIQETPDDNKILRVIYYKDCHAIGSDMATYYDHEEPFATVGGFAINHSIDFDCAGMNPQNPRYDESVTANEQNRNYKMASGLKAIAEFRFDDNTVETIDFPIFIQQNILSKSDATFQLKDIVGDYPLLYKQVDEDAKINQISGVTQTHNLFDVDVNLKYGEQAVRGFSYSDCRVTDYVVATQQGNEEAFFFWFALENTFEFECMGYEPKNPRYDEMFEPVKNRSLSTLDLRETDSWGPLFKYTRR